MAQNDGTGKLIISVRTANGSIPVEGANVTVRSFDEGESSVIAVLKTDNSGNTPLIEIGTPSSDISTSPGNGKGYTSVIIEVDKDGFIPMEFIGGAIFPGITTVQPVNLMPESEYNGDYDKIILNESEAATL